MSVAYFGPHEPQYDIVEFIKKHGEKRILQESCDYYKNPDRPGVVVRFISKGLLGFSASAMTEPGHSITVIEPNVRGRGIATALLKEKMRHVKTKTIVAADNIASLELCRAAGLRFIDYENRKRRGGAEEYVAFIFGQKGFLQWLVEMIV